VHIIYFVVQIQYAILQSQRKTKTLYIIKTHKKCNVAEMS